MAGKFINELSSNPPAPEDLVVFFDKSKAVTVQAPLSDVVGAGLNIATATKGQTAVVDTKVDPISLETIPFLKWEKAGIDFGSTTTKPSAGTDEIITHDPVTGTNGKTTLAELIKSVLPPVTGADAGKQLTVDVNGAAGWTADSSDLPVFSLADAKKQLTVNDAGDAVIWKADPNEIPTPSLADAGKSLLVKSDGTGPEWGSPFPAITTGENVLMTKPDKSGVEWMDVFSFSTLPANGKLYTLCFSKDSPSSALKVGWWLPATNAALHFYPARLRSISTIDGPTPSFARASSGSYFDIAGVLKTAAAGEPRFNNVFNGTSWVSRGLLVEEQRTNICLQSNNLNTSPWTKSNQDTTENAAISPDGTSNASKVVPTNVNASHYTYQPITTIAANYSISFYAKKNGYDFVQLSTGMSVDYVNFNLNTGAVGAKTGGLYSLAKIESVGNGWYRCSAIMAAIPGNSDHGISAVNADTASRRPAFAGDGTSGILLYGFQIEAGSSATSLIPTTTASVIRSADVCQITGNDFMGIWNGAEGAIVVEGDSHANGVKALVSVDDNTANKSFRLFSSGADPRFSVTDGGVAQADIDAGSITPNTPFKMAAAYMVNDFAASVGGGAVVADKTGTVPKVNRMLIGVDQAGNYLNGHIARVRYYRSRLPDSEIEDLTK